MDDAGHRNGICVLTVHRVVETCERDHDITWTSFLGLLDAIVRSDHSIETQFGSEESLRKISVALTFDDGTEDHVQVGEELAKRGMVGIFFVPASKVGAPGRLSFQQVLELHALGHILGSHSYSDVPLRKGMPRHQIKRELGDSKAFFEDALGTEVSYFAPPGGIGCRWLGRELKSYGYRASRSMVWGIYAHPADRWQIPCIPVTEFSVRRGWVTDALAARQLPLPMRFAWVVKRLAPAPMRFSILKHLHDSFRRAQ